MSRKEDLLLHKVRTDLTKKCKCGHSIFMPVYLKRTICTHCGYLVFRDSKEEFRYKMERVIFLKNKLELNS